MLHGQSSYVGWSLGPSGVCFKEKPTSQIVLVVTTTIGSAFSADRPTTFPSIPSSGIFRSVNASDSLGVGADHPSRCATIRTTNPSVVTAR